MKEGIIYLITADAIKEYAEVLNRRIEESIEDSKRLKIPMKFYIGDCRTYVCQLAANNGWSPFTDSADEIFKILQAVVVFSLKMCDVDDTLSWSDDLNYLIGPRK